MVVVSRVIGTGSSSGVPLDQEFGSLFTLFNRKVVRCQKFGAAPKPSKPPGGGCRRPADQSQQAIAGSLGSGARRASAILPAPCRRSATKFPRRKRLVPSNDDGPGFRSVLERLLDEGRREAQGARIQWCDRLSRSQRGRPGLGSLRLGRGGLSELPLRPQGPPIIQEAGHKSRPQPAQFGGKYDA